MPGKKAATTGSSGKGAQELAGVTGSSVDLGKIARGVSLILEGIGEDPKRAGLRDTPRRTAEMVAELTAGSDGRDRGRTYLHDLKRSEKGRRQDNYLSRAGRIPQRPKNQGGGYGPDYRKRVRGVCQRGQANESY